MSIKDYIEETVKATAEGIISAVVLTSLTNTERLMLINIVGAIIIRVIWYWTERKLIQLRNFIVYRNYEPSRPSDQARNTSRNWQKN